VLTGASRVAQAAAERAEALANQQQAALRQRDLQRKRATLEQQIARLSSDYEAEEAELLRIDEQVKVQTRVLSAERRELARLRQPDRTAAGARAVAILKAKQ
jgi:circadian clock protein KaiC